MKILYLASSFHAYIHYPIVKLAEEFNLDYYAYFFKDNIFYFRSKTHREHWKEEGYTIKIDSSKYKIINHYPLPRKILKWTVPYIMYFLIRKEIKIGGYDLIHAQATDPNGLLARILSKKLKIPYIISEHGPDWYFNPPTEGEKEKIINKYNDVFCNAFAVIAVSERFAKSMKSYWTRANIVVNHNSYNNSIFVPPDTINNTSNAATINLITVGTFNTNKNQILLLKAINILKDTYPNIHISLLGRGDITNIYEGYIKENNLREFVTIKDFIPHHQLVKEYHNSHIFILTSKKETFGIVLLEAMACGVAVIASKTDGASSLIQEGVNGLLFENDCVEDLCSKIEILIENPEKRMELIKQGFLTAAKYPYKYRELFDIYKEATEASISRLTNNINIDIVYLWVNGNDPKWKEKRKKYRLDEDFEPGRFSDNEELKYSLRSIDKFAPWINKIFIITDNQVPDWLNTTHQKIRIVDHTEIIPAEYLPCFNSNVLEIFLYKIPDLSEFFLYANDDMFLGKPAKPSDFFVSKIPIIRSFHLLKILKFYIIEFLNRKNKSQYFHFLNNAKQLVKQKHGKSFFFLPHHCIDGYNKTDFKRNIEEYFLPEFLEMAKNRFRNQTDIQRILHNLVALIEKKGHLRYIRENESYPLLIQNEKKYRKLLKKKPLQFCLNDTELASNKDRKYMKIFLEKYFPEKSSFEK